MNSIYNKLNQLVDIPYSRETNGEKAAYLASAAIYIALFALNVIALSNVTLSAHLAVINLSLTLASFGISLFAGALKGAKIGLAREVLQTLPLFIISLLAVLGQGSVGIGMEGLRNMSIGIVATQGISALYYLLGTTCGVQNALTVFVRGGQALSLCASRCTDCSELDEAVERILHMDDTQAAFQKMNDAVKANPTVQPPPVASSPAEAAVAVFMPPDEDD